MDGSGVGPYLTQGFPMCLTMSSIHAQYDISQYDDKIRLKVKLCVCLFSWSL